MIERYQVQWGDAMRTYAKSSRSIASLAGLVSATVIVLAGESIATGQASAAAATSAAVTCELWVNQPTSDLAPINPGDLRSRLATRLNGRGGAVCSEPVKVRVRMRKDVSGWWDETLKEEKQTGRNVSIRLSRWGCKYNDQFRIFMEVIAAEKKRKSVRVSVLCQGTD
jgi:hypothetical protein